jgi:hypothetical protein
MGQNWIFSINPENWNTIKSDRIFAVSRESITKKVGPGDNILIWLTGTYSFRGAFKITSKWSRASKPRFADELKHGKVIYSFEVSLDTLATGVADLRKIKGVCPSSKSRTK